MDISKNQWRSTGGLFVLVVNATLSKIWYRQDATKTAICGVVNIYFLPSKLYGSSKARFLAKNQM